MVENIDVAEARGMSMIAGETLLGRENPYRMISRKGNPQHPSLNALLQTMGLKLVIEVRQNAA